MQFLKQVERLDYIRIVLQSLCTLAKLGLQFQILLEIQIAELIVYLD